MTSTGIQPHPMAQNSCQSSSHYTHVLGKQDGRKGRRAKEVLLPAESACLPLGSLSRNTIEYFYLCITGCKGVWKSSFITWVLCCFKYLKLDFCLCPTGSPLFPCHMLISISEWAPQRAQLCNVLLYILPDFFSQRFPPWQPWKWEIWANNPESDTSIRENRQSSVRGLKTELWEAILPTRQRSVY